MTVRGPPNKNKKKINMDRRDLKLKVYFFYLTLPKDWSSISNPSDAWERFSFITSLFIDDLPKREDEKKSLIHYFYAWTDDKKMAKMYKNSHNMKFFNLIKKDITDEEYLKLQHDLHKIRILDFIKTIDNNDEMDIIPLSVSESSSIDSVISDVGYEYQLTDSAIYPYGFLKPKYIKPLDLLLYCTYHKLSYGKDQDFYVDSWYGYGCTVEGYSTGRGMSLDFNYVNIYREFYGLILNNKEV